MPRFKFIGPMKFPGFVVMCSPIFTLKLSFQFLIVVYGYLITSAQESQVLGGHSHSVSCNSPKCNSSVAETNDIEGSLETNPFADEYEHCHEVLLEMPISVVKNVSQSYLYKDEINDRNILPEPATGLSLKAQNRYLKAKVRVLLEENQKLDSQMTHQNDEIIRLKNRLQELEGERNRLHRVTSAHSTQLEKMKKSLGETRIHCNTLETEKTNYRKDYDSIKRSSDQQAVEIKSLTTRLNRAVEETDRYKAELDKVRSSTRESVESMRHNVDTLMAENRRLEKQKSELISAFKKQMKLIDVLRRQKLNPNLG
ncbi:Testis-expressed protein 9 [Schistosoma japonicum]|nr:Testis-expressed protein 9 [Schistosoma japonicum]